MVKVRDGLSFITANMGNNNYSLPQNYKVGKVYAVMLNERSVPAEVWNANGGWDGVGTILYQEYNESSEVALENLTDANLVNFPTALPLFPNQKYFPLPGEIVLLMPLPSAPSPITNKTEENYYVSIINAWNSPQFNGLFLDEDKSLLYNSFNEDSDFRGLQTFEGDYILEGRFGNSLRFGSTSKSGNEDLTPWSTNPSELTNNPITLLTNQHNFKLPTSDLHVEDINKDGSSVYLTSNQSIPLNIGNVTLSNITAPIGVKDYVKPQVIINADRTVISSKSDEVLVFGKTGVELYSQGPIYLQSKKAGITLQDNAVFLGPSNNSQLTQPLLLGNDTKKFLSDILTTLSTFSSTLINAYSSPEGTQITDVIIAAQTLQDSLKTYSDTLDNPNYLLSQTTYTS
jgi:hypothetical protein